MPLYVVIPDLKHGAFDHENLVVAIDGREAVREAFEYETYDQPLEITPVPERTSPGEGCWTAIELPSKGLEEPRVIGWSDCDWVQYAVRGGKSKRPSGLSEQEQRIGHAADALDRYVEVSRRSDEDRDGQTVDLITDLLRLAQTKGMEPSQILTLVLERTAISKE